MCDMEIDLIKVNKDFKENVYTLIKDFWKEHNNIHITDEEAKKDFEEWTKEGHKLYIIKHENEYIGFAHLGSRGAAIDWLEDLYISKEFQGKGFGSEVIYQLEKIIKRYSESLYIEVAARNLNAMMLYRDLGYDCLNTITIRKDFNVEDFEVIKREQIAGLDFEIKKYKDNK